MLLVINLVEKWSQSVRRRSTYDTRYSRRAWNKHMLSDLNCITRIFHQNRFGDKQERNFAQHRFCIISRRVNLHDDNFSERKWLSTILISPFTTRKADWHYNLCLFIGFSLLIWMSGEKLICTRNSHSAGACKLHGSRRKRLTDRDK